jgi:hypothetical protein
MPRVGFVTTIPGFHREKTLHALDRLDTVTGLRIITSYKFIVDCLLFYETEK